MVAMGAIAIGICSFIQTETNDVSLQGLSDTVTACVESRNIFWPVPTGLLIMSKASLRAILLCLTVSLCGAFSTHGFFTAPRGVSGQHTSIGHSLPPLKSTSPKTAAALSSCRKSVSRTSPKMAIAPDSVLPAMALACLFPTLLGLWKSEYTVSYGYGLSMAFSGFVTFASMPFESLNFVAQAQALCYVLYGLRLAAYLLYREINIPDLFRRESKGDPLSRLPTILGCSLLYLMMAAPLRLATQAGAYTSASQAVAYAGLFLMYSGWAVAALGDFQKTYYKAKNGNGLVTEGVFSFLRHPNYTGEQAMYAGSLICSIAAGFGTASALSGTALAGWAVSAAAGTAGIWFVLMQATASLEKKQAAKYGPLEQYAAWVGSTWAGFALPPKAK